MEQILYGAPVAEQLDKISENIFREYANNDKKPHLTAITVGENPASLLYVSRKQEKAIKLGVEFNWIKLDAETTQDKLDEVISKVDLITINDEEARQLSEEHSLVKAAEKIHAMGPKYVIIKKGEHGAILFGEGKTFIAPAFPIDQVIDPTGAGDSFAGGISGVLANTDTINFETLKMGIIYGSVLASFTVEEFGVNALLAVTSDLIKDRIEKFRELTRFEWNEKQNKI